MGDGDRTSKKITRAVEMENLSLDVSKSSSSRDLLQRFMGSSSDFGSKGAENEEIELNLGLSLGGRFGVDRNTDNLVRSSSIASCLPIARDDSSDVAGGGCGPPPPPAEGPAYSSLARTSSLPVETEEEWRKRKEMQSLRRLEAKRRRSEKQRNLRSERESLRSEREKESLISAEEKREIEVNVRGRLDREKSLNAIRRQGSTVGGGLAAMAAMIAAAKGKGSGYLGSQGSVESKGGSCSSDLESKTLQGSSGELSPASIQSLQEVANQDIGSSTTKAREHTTRTESSSRRSTDVARNRGKEIGINALEDMPCVFTKGDGPNGRRIDGILYKYGKGEEVRIMCVCHGTFHSPAEFVRHAGGTDVDNPLKHIVVNPNSAPLV